MKKQFLSFSRPMRPQSEGRAAMRKTLAAANRGERPR